MCGRRSKQRRLLKTVFMLGLKIWRLGGPRDILLGDRYTAWGGENLQDRFGGLGGGQWRHQVCFKFTHTKENKMEASWGIFTNFDIFLTLFLHIIQGQTHIAQLEGNNLGQKISKLQKYFGNTFQNCKHFVQYKGIAQCFLAQTQSKKQLNKGA